MSRLDDVRQKLRASLDARGPIWVEPPVLQPAAVYLELSGEEIRRRAFLIDDASHGALCLRPDMTAPAVRVAFDLPKLPPLVAYEGLVFRRQAPGSERESEFTQIGAEWLGKGEMDASGEAQVIAAALEGARAAGVEARVKLGDFAILAGFVAALGLDEPWPARVVRALSRTGGLAALRVEKSAASQDEGAGLAEALATLSPEHAEAALNDLLAHARITPVGGRPIAEIARRLQQRGKLAAAAPPNAAQYDLLDQLTHIEAADGLDRVAKLAESKLLKNRAPAEAAIAKARARLDALKGALPKSFSFAPGLGRTLAYYDGFVFELEAPTLGDRASLGGGGRYDGLARALWNGRGDAPSLYAAGFALRPLRLAEAAS
ncbi:MAG TPA: ATP phosphoribosyltransferase regulatory subunit [Caulobacterales bacterium]|nr:ATP phosphoribosyltransferase regulatory subunit [Caulobacterales bacterium]